MRMLCWRKRLSRFAVDGLPLLPPTLLLLPLLLTWRVVVMTWPPHGARRDVPWRCAAGWGREKSGCKGWAKQEEVEACGGASDERMRLMVTMYIRSHEYVNKNGAAAGCFTRRQQSNLNAHTVISTQQAQQKCDN
jgi:hypothetical protein